MHNGDFMIKATFNKDKFTIIIPIEKFKSLWDDSYSAFGDYELGDKKLLLGLNHKKIDLNSFVAEQILSSLNKNGEEDESVNNEWFEDCDATNCIIKDIVDGNIIITGCIKHF